MHNLGATHMILCRVAITLEYALEVAQKPFGTFPPTAHSEVEHHCSARPGCIARGRLGDFLKRSMSEPALLIDAWLYGTYIT